MTTSEQIKPSQILIAGATGLIGEALVEVLLQRGFAVMILTRDLNRIPLHLKDRVGYMEWTGNFSPHLTKEVKQSFAIINLAGEGIADKPWTRKRRFQLIRSRLASTRALAKACHYATKKPQVFIQASAVGYYPSNTKELLKEDHPAGSSFLSRLVVDWEAVGMYELPEDIRLILLRSGIVLSNKGGMLPKLIKPIKFFAGAWFGTGKMPLSWIHITDQANAIVHLLNHPHAQGPYNLVAPNPVTQKKLVRKLAKKLRRLAWLSVPPFIIKWIFGAMGREVLLAGQNVSSAKLEDSGFEFSYPTIGSTIDNLVS